MPLLPDTHAALWQTAVGRLKLPLPIGRFVDEHLPKNRIELLAIGISDLASVKTLPFHRRDPFDRIMAVQAIEER